MPELKYYRKKVILEEELYKKLLAKDKKTQIYFYRYCYNVLMRIAVRYKNNKDDAGILVNDAFMKILKNIETYDRNKSLEAWIKRITINVAIDDYRKNKKYNTETMLIDTLEYQNTFVVEEIEKDDNLDIVLKKIDELLPKAVKVVFYLKIKDGFSHKEIAEKLGITVETSKSYIKHANRIFKLNKKKILS